MIWCECDRPVEAIQPPGLDPGRPSRSACWRGAAGFRSSSPRRRGGKDSAWPAWGSSTRPPEELRGLCDSFQIVGVAKLGGMIRAFRRQGVERIVMAGKVTKNVMYTPWRMLQLCPDLRMIQWWYRGKRADNRDDSLLLSIIAEFERDGMTFASALDYCPELLVKDGILTRRAPTSAEQKDIEFGWKLAKEMGRLDVGQSVAVKEKAALAVEAIEGTDRCIERAGQLCRAGGWALVKVAKPQQDMRFDVPTIGVTTIENLHKAACPGPGDRGRQDDPARPARGGRARRPLWAEHRGAGVSHEECVACPSGPLDDLGGIPLGNPGLNHEVIGQHRVGVVEHVRPSGRDLLSRQVIESANVLLGIAWLQKVEKQVVHRDPRIPDFRAEAAIMTEVGCHRHPPEQFEVLKASDQQARP